MANIDTIPADNAEGNFWIKLLFPEFKIKSPSSDAHEQAELKIIYAPNEKIAENHSLTEFLEGYEKSVYYQEPVTLDIAKNLNEALNPKFLLVEAHWQACHKLHSIISKQYGEMPQNLHVTFDSTDFKKN